MDFIQRKKILSLFEMAFFLATKLVVDTARCRYNAVQYYTILYTAQ